MTALQEFLSSDITRVAPMVRVAKAGDLFGIEIECEGKGVGYDGASKDILKDWAPHVDGSLRAWKGHDPCEWVFNGPVKYKKTVERINNLFDYFDKRNAQLHPSNRTSVHVHFNIGDKAAYQVVNLFILFTILEDILDRYCGEDRNGNLFCLSSRHAEEQIRWINNICFKHFQFQIGDNNRYCSLNMASINKFGSVEFRGMRGLDNRQDVIDWINILNEFTQYACYTMKNPASLVESISYKTPIGFLKEVFSDVNVAKLVAGLTEDQINASVYEGLRLVQMLCYKIGTEFDQVRLKGKDFWASFADDKDPELDIDPALINAKPVKARRAPAVPFANQPDAIRPIEEMARIFGRAPQVRMVEEDVEMQRAGKRIRINRGLNDPQWFRIRPENIAGEPPAEPNGVVDDF